MVTNDLAAIEALFVQLRSAHASHDADAIHQCYAPAALIFDLAPPLSRNGLHRDHIAKWLASWDGPVLLDMRELEITAEDTLAFASALCRIQGRQAGIDQSFWYRSTTALRKDGGRWQITCEHASVPFYMDGSTAPPSTFSHRRAAMGCSLVAARFTIVKRAPMGADQDRNPKLR